MRSFRFFEGSVGAVADIPVLFFASAFTGVVPAVAALSFGGKGSSFFNYQPQLRLWRHVTNLGPSRRAPDLISQMDDVARKVCINAGSDATWGGDCADQILNVPREHFSPAAVDSVFREASMKKSDDGRLLRRGAESKMGISRAFTRSFAFVCRTQDAGQVRPEKS